MRIEWNYVSNNVVPYTDDLEQQIIGNSTSSFSNNKIFHSLYNDIQHIILNDTHILHFIRMFDITNDNMGVLDWKVFTVKLNSGIKTYYSYYPHTKEPDRINELMVKFGVKQQKTLAEILQAFTPMKKLQLSHNWKEIQYQFSANSGKLEIQQIFNTYAYEEDTAMTEYGCFFENEPILTLNGVKKIKDVTTEDYVYSNGKFMPVKEVAKREQDGAMIGFYLLSTTDQFVTTPNHPIYVLRDNEYQFVEAQDITFKDKLAIPIPKNLYHVKSTDEIGKVLEFQIYGKSIGIGKLSYRKKPKFCSKAKQEGNYWVIEDMDLWEKVHNYKFELPAEYLLYSKKIKKFIVNYYYETVSKKNKSGVSFAFISSALAYQFQLLLAALGIDSKIFGKYRNKKFAIVSIREEAQNFLFDNAKEFSYKNIEFDKNYMLVPVQTKFVFNYRGNVYNIEINDKKEDNKVFTVKNILVHNSYLAKGVMPPKDGGARITTGGEYFDKKTAMLTELTLEEQLTGE